MLTILGYSINDTVVIYDRIRENSALFGKKQMSLTELVNLSVNQSFSRSLMTSVTTCLALGVICVVSVVYRLDSIYTFASGPAGGPRPPPRSGCNYIPSKNTNRLRLPVWTKRSPSLSFD